MEDKLISVIITTYNCEHFIEDAIKSVMLQTYRPLELIIIDGGSTDRTVEMTNKMFKYFPQKIEVEVHDGFYASHARNRGVERSNGECIAFLDGDDMFYPDGLKILASKMTPNLHMVYGDFMIIGINKEHLARHDSGEYRPLILPSQCFIHTGASLIHRNVFNIVGGFDETLHIAEDIDFWCKMALADCKVAYVPELIMMHRHHPRSISKRGRFRMDVRIVQDRYYDLFRKRFK